MIERINGGDSAAGDGRDVDDDVVDDISRVSCAREEQRAKECVRTACCVHAHTR